MKYDRLDDMVLVDRLSISKFLYFLISQNKFMVYHDTIEEEAGRYSSSGVVFTLLTFGGTVLLRFFSKFSDAEYIKFRILILVGITLIVVFVAKDMAMELFLNRHRNDIYWNPIDVSKQELPYYLNKLEKTYKKIIVVRLILLLLAFGIGTAYIMVGEILILPLYMGFIFLETATLTSHSYKLYRIAKKQMIQLIESEENRKY